MPPNALNKKASQTGNNSARLPWGCLDCTANLAFRKSHRTLKTSYPNILLARQRENPLSQHLHRLALLLVERAVSQRIHQCHQLGGCVEWNLPALRQVEQPLDLAHGTVVIRRDRAIIQAGIA